MACLSLRGKKCIASGLVECNLFTESDEGQTLGVTHGLPLTNCYTSEPLGSPDSVSTQLISDIAMLFSSFCRLSFFAVHSEQNYSSN